MYFCTDAGRQSNIRLLCDDAREFGERDARIDTLRFATGLGDNVSRGQKFRQACDAKVRKCLSLARANL